MAAKLDRIERKIRGLLAQAEDREGTPEGDAFRDRAFELMARHSVSEESLRSEDDGEVVAINFDLTGAYRNERYYLLARIAEPLHCRTVKWSQTQRRRRSQPVSMTLVGARRHAKRVEMLYSILAASMAAGAASVSAAPGTAPSTIAMLRRSYMYGFANMIDERLQAAEKTATDDANEGAALVLVDDAARADEYMKRFGKLRARKPRARLDSRSYASGAAAAENSDLGQSRVSAQNALPAA